MCVYYSQVNGFPTLILFRDGKKVTEHSGGRDIETLTNFINVNIPHDELWEIITVGGFILVCCVLVWKVRVLLF